MTWINETLTSLLYGAAAGIGVLGLTDIDDITLLVVFMVLGVATELYRGRQATDS